MNTTAKMLTIILRGNSIIGNSGTGAGIGFSVSVGISGDISISVFVGSE